MKISRKKVIYSSIVCSVLLSLLLINQGLNKGRLASKVDGNINQNTKDITSESENNIDTVDGVNFKYETIDTNKTNDSNRNSDKSLDPLKGENDIPDKVTVQINELVKEYYSRTDKIDKSILSVEKKKEADQSAKQIVDKREGIEAYKNIKTYIKPGLTEDSYVVFATYDIKLYHIDTVVPGMSVLTVTTDSTDKFRISDTEGDKALKTYIDKLVKEKDIKKIIEEVNVKFTEAMKSDGSLKEFIQYLKKAS